MKRKFLAVERLEPRLVLSVALGQATSAEQALLPEFDFGQTTLAEVRKLIVAGDPSGTPPDLPANRVDANSEASPYAGVGSLEIHSGNSVFLCTASVIGPQHVLTAGHCLDLNDNGTIDVVPDEVTFHLNSGGSLTDSIRAEELHIHPNFTGFANPVVNDDVAVIKLSRSVAEGVPIYPLNADPAASGQQITMVGYGQSGDGVNGYYVNAAFDVKRVGGNRTDDLDVDDDGSGQVEVFVADFDGATSSTNYIGGTTLGNNIEATLGGGDSGGPSFVSNGAGLELYGINTFTTRFVQFLFFLGPPAPLFGSGFGGIAVAPYFDWITSIIGAGGGDAPPSVKITNPADFATESGMIDVTADASDDIGVEQVEFSVDGASIGVDIDGSNGWSVSWDTTSVGDGSRTIEAIATDSAGQTGRDSVVVTVDNILQPVQLYFSVGASATIGGLSVARDDIVAWEGSSFSLFFDGSDVGLTDQFGTLTIDALSIISANEILLSFAEPGGILGFGSFDDSDIVKFTATSLGENTAGTWAFYFDGSDVGLTQAGEDIDALELLTDSRLLISTTGSVNVPGASGRAQDLLAFTPSRLGTTTSGTWAVYFDGSDVALEDSSENVDGTAIGSAGEIYLSTTGNFSVPGGAGANEDVFLFRPTRRGATTQGIYDTRLYFDGSVLGLGSLDVKAFDVPAENSSSAARAGFSRRELGVTDLPLDGRKAWMGATRLARAKTDVFHDMDSLPNEARSHSNFGLPGARPLAARLQIEDAPTQGRRSESCHEPMDRVFSELGEADDDSNLLGFVLPLDVDELHAKLLAG